MIKCNPKHLSVQSYSNGTTFWSYRASDDNARERDVLSRNWWQPVADMIRAGDPIFVSGKEWGCWLYVNTIKDGAVTVLPMGRTPL